MSVRKPKTSRINEYKEVTPPRKRPHVSYSCCVYKIPKNDYDFPKEQRGKSINARILMKIGKDDTGGYWVQDVEEKLESVTVPKKYVYEISKVDQIDVVKIPENTEYLWRIEKGLKDDHNNNVGGTLTGAQIVGTYNDQLLIALPMYNLSDWWSGYATATEGSSHLIKLQD